MSEVLRPRAMRTAIPRVDAVAKVTGHAPYAYEQPTDNPVYAQPVQATIARGRVTAVSHEALDGVIAVLTHENAPKLASVEDAELAVLQSPEVAFRGQLIGVVLAETPEIARHAASLVRVEYEAETHDVELRADREDLYRPDSVNPSFAPDTDRGDVPGAFADAPVLVEATYTTAMNHNNPMEPHTTVARWHGEKLTLHDSTQGVHSVRQALAPVLGVASADIRVVAPYVGGGFGAKGTAHAHLVLAALAARRSGGRPVKLALTRQQMFSLVGYRTPTIQRVGLAAARNGSLLAITHDVVEQTSRIKEFAEQTAVPTRSMYAAPNRRTTHRLAALDVPVPSWMRAPGECPGMFGPEVAMDELAVACGVDPVELRIRNEPEVEPESGLPFSSRDLVGCLREGARRCGWADRDPTPRARLRDGWWTGTGVASSAYPVHRMPGSVAEVGFDDGRYTVSIGAVDIGTGAWTVLTQIAADALAVDTTDVRVRIGDTDLPPASVAGGSSGTTSWGSAIVAAATAFRKEHGDTPRSGTRASAETPENPAAERYAMHAFGAQFVEIRVHADTGEIRVPRITGVFAAGRILNPRTARSQFVGGMTMGLSMALHEDSVVDARYGHVVNHDFAEYHIASCADVGELDVSWLDEDDSRVNPMGSKGIGEIGIVGTAAAVANAAFHATGVRVRNLPITADRFLGRES